LGDELRLQQVFINLLLNAVQAMPAGGRLEVAAELLHAPARRGSRQRKSVRVRVADTGMGMSAEDLARVFEPFHTTKGADGTGLGLSVVQWILDKHGASIAASSDGPGKGASFVLDFPIAEPEARRLEAAPAPAAEAAR
jgi:two-component system NtrC family sensor kinase